MERSGMELDLSFSPTLSFLTLNLVTDLMVLLSLIRFIIYFGILKEFSFCPKLKLIPMSLQPDSVNLWYFKLKWLLELPEYQRSTTSGRKDKDVTNSLSLCLKGSHFFILYFVPRYSYLKRPYNLKNLLDKEKRNCVF